MTVNFNFRFIIIGTVILCLLRGCQVSGIECGRVKFGFGLVRGGSVAERSEWPFIAALYEARPTKYICGGTLISNKHVLTAAHCIHRRHSSVELSPDKIKVRLGAFNLTVENEIGSVHRNVSDIFIHSDWRVYGDKYDADIAVLVLSDNVTFTIYIQPVCMPADDVVVDSATIDVKGTFVGWGLAENEIHEEIPMRIKANSYSNSFCFREDPGIVISSSNRTFCAKSEDGTPNKGDSGGGFLVVFRSFWVQYGIVSALRTNETGYPEMNAFAIYTNVKLFKSWIVGIVQQSGGEVGEPSINVTLACRYGYTYNHGYACEVNDLEIRNEHTEVASINGSHVFNKENDDVECFQFNSGFIFTLPNGLGKIFKNIRTLQIGNLGSPSLGLKHIGRSSLKNLENLWRFYVLDNDVEILDEDCLWDLPNLISFHLINNNLKTLHEKTFGNNEQLRMIYITENNLEALPRNVFRSNSRLQEIDLRGNSLKKIDEQIFELNTVLKVLSLSSNQLELVPRNLFKNNLFLMLVDLSNNSLTSIDEQFFENNVELIRVNLSSNKLVSLPSNLFKNNLLLKTVDLGSNLLRTIDERIFETNTKLNLVVLSSNELDSIPRYLFKNHLFRRQIGLNRSLFERLDIKISEVNDQIVIESLIPKTNDKLIVVQLSSNKLESLHRKLFENHSFIAVVNISCNSLKSIKAQTFDTNLNLRLLSLSSNQLQSLPRKLFKNNLLLKVVQLGKNSFKTIDENIFETNLELRIIDLESNQLEFVPSFKNNLLLMHLNLGNNSLKMLDDRIFDTNAYLKKVYLFSNYLESLSANLFKHNLLLEVINFDKNSIKTLDEHNFKANVKLKKVFFESNQLELLTRNLFKKNSLLEVVDFRNNSLKVIEINFTELQNVKKITFYDNICIHTIYSPNNDNKAIEHFINLTAFQNVINTNCSSSTQD